MTNVALENRANKLLETCYRRLLTFECQNPRKFLSREGYEWFGGTAPPHEGLTAYGLMLFRDMTRVHDEVDRAMIDRTRQFLLSRRDGKGGFERRQGRGGFGTAPEHILNAYVVWALSENSKEDDLDKELSALLSQAESSTDSYFMALVANSLLNRDRASEAKPLLQKLSAAQTPDGHVGGGVTSITRSAGRDLQIETTALAVLAWTKAKHEARDSRAMHAAVRWLGKQRGGHGGYGSTQATILALKAFLAVDRLGKAFQAGEVALRVNDRIVSSQRFDASAMGVISLRLDHPEKHLKPGKNVIRLEMAGESEIPYTLSWSYRTRKPPSAADCAVRLRTQLDRDQAQEGDTVRLSAVVENITPAEHGMAVAIIGLPAGLTLPEDMKQLKELARPRADGSSPISAWEVRGRELILYWRGLAPEQKINIDLELICRVPGEYRGPASRAYLYYNADDKCWDEPLRMVIKAKEE